MAEFSRRFAQSVAHRIDELLKTHGANSLVLVAEPQILGLLRDAITPKSVIIQTLAKDLCSLKPHELQNYLAKQDLLPAYRSVLPS
jgi:protein required for attachment to host cells